MERRTNRSMLHTLLTVAVLVPAVVANGAEAARLRGGPTVLVGAGQTIHDDLYACSGNVEIQGTVDGDLFACGGNVTVSGTVTGDLFAGGGTVVVTGNVGRTVRVGGGRVTVSGAVTNDLLGGGGEIQLAPGGTVGRDVIAGGGMVSLDGEVGRNVRVGAGTFRLRGTVHGEVRARADVVRLTDQAVIGGNLIYASPHELVRAPGATVAGTVERRVLRGGYGARNPVARIIGGAFLWMRMLIGLLAFGLLFLWIQPAWAGRTLETLRGSPGPSLGVGVLLLVGVPIVSFTAFLLGLLIGGWWIGAGVMIAFLFTTALGLSVSGMWLGRLMLGRRQVRRGWAMLLGLAILTLLIRVPVLGVLLAAVGMVLGMGGLVIAAWRGRRAGAAAPAPAAA